MKSVSMESRVLVYDAESKGSCGNQATSQAMLLGFFAERSDD